MTRLPLNAGVIRNVETPAYVFDERRVLRDLKTALELRDRCGFKLLYALKPLSCEFILELMIGKVDGFAASSLFEARLASGRDRRQWLRCPDDPRAARSARSPS